MSNVMQIPAYKLHWAARVALKATSKDDVTPVLTGVHFTVEGGKLSLVGTDRYRVHVATVDVPDAPDGEFLMDRHQVEWMLRSVHKPVRIYRDQLVRITWEGGEVEPGQSTDARFPRRTATTIRVDVFGHDGDDAPVFSYKAQGIAGNFPPVLRLMPTPDKADEVVTEFGVTPQFLADTRVLTESRGEPLKFYTPRALDPSGSQAKLNPFLVANVSGTARALIQPNLLFDR